MDRIRYREITVKSALTRVHAMPSFSWSLNPYRGGGFDREIEVKINFAQRLRDELRRLRLREAVALGTATDPYQHCEGRYRITRRTLEALVESPLPLVVMTNGTLIVRDIDLLVRLARRTSVRVCFSVATVGADLARGSEPAFPPPSSRVEAVRRLRAADLDAGVIAAPILPGLSDRGASLEAVAIADRVNPDPPYVDQLDARIERARRRHGFHAEPARVALTARRGAPPSQLRLSEDFT